MPIRLILARHGNTFESDQVPTQVGAKTDLPLTAQGRAQASQLAEFLATQRQPLAAIYAGGLKRQTETAQIVADKLGASLYLKTAGLTEIDYGAWEGLTTNAISQQWSKEYTGWTDTLRWPEGIFEGSLHDHIAKILAWMETLRQLYASEETVLGVTSNGILRLIHSLVEQKTVKVKTGYFCELLLFPGKFEIVSWNLRPTSREEWSG
jgi:broad specificity phosphatase PhoE